MYRDRSPPAQYSRTKLMNFSLFCVSKHRVNSCYHMLIDGLQDTV